LEGVLVLTEEVDVVGLAASAEAGVWHVLLLLVLLLQLWLLVDGRGEVSEGVREIVAGEAAPVACHCVIWKVLPLGSSCAILLQGYSHAVAGVVGTEGLGLIVALTNCAYVARAQVVDIVCGLQVEMWWNAEGTMQMKARAGVVAAPAVRALPPRHGVQQPRRQAAPQRQSSDLRCVSTHPHNEALIVSSAYSTPQLALLPAFVLTTDPRSRTLAKPNITGFDPQKFAAAAKNGTRGDPWAR
jgi:hypothetical protein